MCIGHPYPEKEKKRKGADVKNACMFHVCI